ncbi:hypothetical protein GCM10022245_60130 [Streptomyces mayteni]
MASTLRAEGATRVVPLVVARPAAGRRAVDPVAVASLAVSFAGTLVAVVDVVRRWLAEGSRGNTVPSVRIVLGEDSLEITEPRTATEERLVEEFLRRHTPR